MDTKDYIKKLSIRYAIDEEKIEELLPIMNKYDLHIYDAKILKDKYKKDKYIAEKVNERKFINRIQRWLNDEYKVKNTYERFQQSADHFKKYGKYTNEIKNKHPNSKYFKFWKEEIRRSIYGYLNGDEWVTGYHYFYLNYAPIELTKTIYTLEDNNAFVQGERIEDFPLFWDGDLLYFHYLEEAERHGLSAVGLKSRGKGYLQPNYEIVLTPKGKKRMGELKVGDEILTPKGTTSKVLEVYYHGIKDIYEVELSDGRRVRCGLEHLWQVYENGKYKTIMLKDIIQKGLYNTYKNNKVYRYHLPEIQEIPYKKQNLPINPYLLGLLLGDGSLSTGSIKISSIDKEILEKIQDILGNEYELIYDNTTSCNYRIIYKKARKAWNKYNPLKNNIIKLKLNKTHKNKFIPDIYKYSSIDQRYELVRGLMDSDGSITKQGTIEFTNTSRKLVYDLAEVLRSLGISCKISYAKRTGYNSINGRKIKRNNYYRLHIKTNKPIFKLSRKLNRIRKNQKRFVKPYIKSITYIGKTESSCILIDDPDHLYLTRDYIPTHNSWKSATMMNRNFYLIPKSRSIVYAADDEYLGGGDGILTKCWSQHSFLDTYTPWAKKKQKKDTHHYKRASYISYENGVEVEKGYMSEIIGKTLGNSPSKSRGKRAKLILYEEAGSFKDLIQSWIVAKPSVAQGRVVYGLRIAFGTGGDVAHFQGLNKLFYKPKVYDVYGINNFWTKGSESNLVGWFNPEYINREGFYDKDGNTNIHKAKEDVLREREKLIESGADIDTILRTKAEQPIIPEEALLRVGGSPFPRTRLKDRLLFLEKNHEAYSDVSRGKLLFNNEGKIVWQENAEIKIIETHNASITNREGGIEIYQHPIDAIKESTYGYIIGVDPIDFDFSEVNDDEYSLGSCFVMNTITGRLVAEYTGRPELADTFYENVRRLALYYNAKVMYENNIKGLYTYFVNRYSEHLLAYKPKILDDGDTLISVGRRKYGYTANERINKIALNWIKKWLTQVIDDEGNLTIIDTIKSKGLLNELIEWHKDGNFDRVSAMIALMIFYKDIERLIEEQINDTDKDEMNKFWTRPFRR